MMQVKQYDLLSARGIMTERKTADFPRGTVLSNRDGRRLVITGEREPYGSGQRAIPFEGLNFRDVCASDIGAECISPIARLELEEEILSEAEVLELESAFAGRRAAWDKQQHDEHQARKAELERGLELMTKAVPSWAKGAVVAQHHEDRSDPMSDYFGHTTTDFVILAWSRTGRNNFDEFRKAALNFEETRWLATADKKEHEHRENYSMGSGLYLGSWKHDTGWKIRKYDLSYRGNFEDIARALAKNKNFAPNEGSAAAQILAGPVEGVSVSENEERNGVEIRFGEKPSAEVRSGLKANGFRWSKNQGLWYAKRSERTLTFARSLADNSGVSQAA